MTTASQLRARRNYLGYSQLDMAQLLGLTRNHYVRLENGAKIDAGKAVALLLAMSRVPKVTRRRLPCQVPAESFWPLVERTGPTPTGRGPIGQCWTWSGLKNAKSGYGYMHHRGKPIPAHRISFALHNGGILDGLVIIHICDNKSCVNPDHLREGTNQDNLDDLVTKRQLGIMPGRQRTRNQFPITT